MAKKKPISNEKYLRNPNQCPSCQGADISAGEFNADGNEAWQKVTCENCGATWNDCFKLYGYADLTLKGAS